MTGERPSNRSVNLKKCEAEERFSLWWWNAEVFAGLLGDRARINAGAFWELGLGSWEFYAYIPRIRVTVPTRAIATI
jgi:hypothetical protein